MLGRMMLTLTAVAGLTSLGCRACSSCYDYSPPVADCVCGTCGCGGRSGSVASGYVPSSGEVIHSGPVMEPVPAEPVLEGPEAPGPR